MTVVIPTYARPELLRLTLLGLCAQTELNHLEEVIVVSDGHDDVASLIVAEFARRLPVRYMEQQKCGVSAARNLGISAANSRVIMLLDDDVVPHSELIAEHANFHRQHPETSSALLGYVTWHPELEVTPFMKWYGERGALFAFGLLKHNSRIDPRYFYSCNVSLKREFLLANRGFNEALTVLEDNELGHRLALNGMRLVFRKSALGYHYQTFTFSQACRRLERYSVGLDSFLATPAGKVLAKERKRIFFRLADTGVRMVCPLLRHFVPILDSKRKLPNFCYRLMYWYYASYLCFWARANQRPVGRN